MHITHVNHTMYLAIDGGECWHDEIWVEKIGPILGIFEEKTEGH